MKVEQLEHVEMSRNKKMLLSKWTTTHLQLLRLIARQMEVKPNIQYVQPNLLSWKLWKITQTGSVPCGRLFKRPLQCLEPQTPSAYQFMSCLYISSFWALEPRPPWLSTTPLLLHGQCISGPSWSPSRLSMFLPGPVAKWRLWRLAQCNLQGHRWRWRPIGFQKRIEPHPQKMEDPYPNQFFFQIQLQKLLFSCSSQFHLRLGSRSHPTSCQGLLERFTGQHRVSQVLTTI